MYILRADLDTDSLFAYAFRERNRYGEGAERIVNVGYDAFLNGDEAGVLSQ